MAAHIKTTPMSVHSEVHEYCIAMDPQRSVRHQFPAGTPKKPSWLTDHYVANALETLWRERKIVKAVRHDRMTWPPSKGWYDFWIPKQNTSAEDEAAEFETEDMCKLYQGISRCSVGERYEYEAYAETVSARETRFGTMASLKESVPPCQRCWESHAREDQLWGLMRSITEHDLAGSFTDEISGRNQEFVNAVASVYLQTDAETDVPTVKRVLQRGIEIRRQQLGPTGLSGSKEWSDQQTADFSDALAEYIRGEFK